MSSSTRLGHAAPSPSLRPTRRGLWRFAAWSATLLACGLTFTLYTHPEVLISLADQLWACF